MDSRMVDIAEMAGVSIATVSRAINQPDKVSARTRQRVETVIEQLGYVPNVSAGALPGGKSKVIGAVVPSIDNSLFSETIKGLADAVSAGGYELVLGQAGYLGSGEERLVEAFIGRRVDGMVLTGVNHSARTRDLCVRRGIPVVETWDLTPNPIDMMVGFSNSEAGAAVGRLFASIKRKQVAFVGGAAPRAQCRLEGLQRALRQSGLPPAKAISLPSGTSFARGRQAMAQLLDSDNRVDAVFFSNDALAVGAILECQRRGVKVPGKVAIVGFADLEIAAEVIPTLTTVQVRARYIGEAAAELLMSRATDRPISTPVIDVGFSLVRRESA